VKSNGPFLSFQLDHFPRESFLSIERARACGPRESRIATIETMTRKFAIVERQSTNERKTKTRENDESLSRKRERERERERGGGKGANPPLPPTPVRSAL